MNSSADEAWMRLKDAMERNLFENILPFWRDVAPDRENGGFHGSIDNAGVVDKEAPKGLVMHARLLWTFSAVGGVNTDSAWDEGARQALDFLRNRLADPIHGGYWWSTDFRGRPEDRNKVVYGQAFALYGLSEYLRRSEDDAVRDEADALFALMEDRARLPGGGYAEILTEGWKPHPDGRLSETDVPCRTSMNTNLHVLEACTAYCRIRPEAAVRTALADLLRWFCRTIYDPERRHLTLFLDGKGRSVRDVDSYGHDIEAAWLLREAAEVLGDEELIRSVEAVAAELAEAALTEGMTGPDGGMDYERHGSRRDTDRHWWVQAEAVTGFRDRWECDGADRWIRAARDVWAFIEGNLVDREGGEWLAGIDAAGIPLERAKAGFWKTPYHNGRACLEMMRRVGT